MSAATTKAPPLPAAYVKAKGHWHHGNLRESLIHWGTQLLDKHGPEGMSLRATAKLAGVSQGAPAHHFSDKNGLLAAIAAQGFRDLIAMRRERLAAIGKDDHRGQLRAVLHAYVEFSQRYPARFELMFGPWLGKRETYPELVEQGTASYALLRDVVRPLLPLEHSVLTEDEAANIIWASVHGLAILRVHRRSAPIRKGPRQSIEQLTEALVMFCLLAIDGLQQDG